MLRKVQLVTVLLAICAVAGGTPILQSIQLTQITPTSAFQCPYLMASRR